MKKIVAIGFIRRKKNLAKFNSLSPKFLKCWKWQKLSNHINLILLFCSRLLSKGKTVSPKKRRKNFFLAITQLVSIVMSRIMKSRKDFFSKKVWKLWGMLKNSLKITKIILLKKMIRIKHQKEKLSFKRKKFNSKSLSLKSLWKKEGN